MNVPRRDLLEAVGAGLSVTLAGCVGGGDGASDAGTTTTGGVAETTSAADATTTATGTTTTADATTTDEETATTGTTTTESNTATVVAANDQFDPVRLSVAPGTTVTWDNRETGTYGSHSVKSAQFHEKAASWSFEKSLGKGESVSYTFEKPGVYEYYCTVHGEGTMCGAVLVGDVSLETSLPCEASGTTTDDGYGDDY